MPQQQKPNFLDGVDGLFHQQPAKPKGSQQQKGPSESGIKQAQKLITAQKTFQQRLRQYGSSIDDVTPPKFKMGEPVYFVENKHRFNGVITQVPSGQTQILQAQHNVIVPWKTMMEKNPYFQDILGSGSVWNMDGERLYLIKLDDGTISCAYESDLFSNVRQQSQHTKQSFLQKNKQLKTVAHKAIYGKIGLDVIVKFNDHLYSGEIIGIPPDGTVIYDISDEHFGNNTSIIKWKKNNRSDENLIESFEDQLGTGSVWYFPKNKKPIRKYFVKLLNQNVVLVSESKISLTKRTTRFF